jgi:hypothetical protein
METEKLPTPPFFSKEEKIALIESVKDIVVASIQKISISFDDHKDYARKTAEMFYTAYNEIIKNSTHK